MESEENPNPAIEVMCALFGLSREQVLAQIEENRQQIEELRRVSSRTPLEGESAEGYVDSVLSMCYNGSRTVMSQ